MSGPSDADCAGAAEGGDQGTLDAMDDDLTTPLREALEEMAGVLAEHGEPRWADAVRRHAERLEGPDDPRDTARDVKGMFGGAGSLSDVVLWVDGAAPREANERLDELKDRVFRAADDLASAG